jgi:hypothetical protein
MKFIYLSIPIPNHQDIYEHTVLLGLTYSPTNFLLYHNATFVSPTLLSLQGTRNGSHPFHIIQYPIQHPHPVTYLVIASF